MANKKLHEQVVDFKPVDEPIDFNDEILKILEMPEGPIKYAQLKELAKRGSDKAKEQEDAKLPAIKKEVEEYVMKKYNIPLQRIFTSKSDKKPGSPKKSKAGIYRVGDQKIEVKNKGSWPKQFDGMTDEEKEACRVKE